MNQVNVAKVKVNLILTSLQKPKCWSYTVGGDLVDQRPVDTHGRQVDGGWELLDGLDVLWEGLRPHLV